MSYYVYGIIDPRTHSIIYVGQTSQPLHVRLTAHCRNEASSAYQAIQFMREDGFEPGIVIINHFEELSDALKFEQHMIASLRGLFNKHHKWLNEWEKVVPKPLPQVERRGRGRPRIHPDRKAYKAAHEANRRAKLKEGQANE